MLARSSSSATELERSRLWVVIATILLNVAVVTALSFVSWSDWRTGLGLNVLDNAILVGFAVLRRDRLMGRLLVFGLIIGFLELLTDAWIVDVSRTLDYAYGGGPMIWRSPIWMPLAWEVVAVQFGYIGLRLYELLGVGGLVLTGLIGAINIPFYEEMALRIHWWRYHDTRMFPHTHTPWAIIIGEFFIAVFFAWFARWLRGGKFATVLLAGCLAGLSIFVGYAVPYWLIG